MAPAEATAAATSAAAATNDLNGSGEYFMPSLYAKRERRGGENLSGGVAAIGATPSGSGVNSGGTSISNEGTSYLFRPVRHRHLEIAKLGDHVFRRRLRFHHLLDVGDLPG